MLDNIIVKIFYHSIPLTKAIQKGNLRRVSSFDRLENRFSKILIYSRDIYFFLIRVMNKTKRNRKKALKNKQDYCAGLSDFLVLKPSKSKRMRVNHTYTKVVTVKVSRYIKMSCKLRPRCPKDVNSL